MSFTFSIFMYRTNGYCNQECGLAYGTALQHNVIWATNMHCFIIQAVYDS